MDVPSSRTNSPGEIYGMLAEFYHAEELLEASRRAYAAGFRKMDAYAPIPVEGLREALGIGPSRLPWLTFLGGFIGGVTGYLMQYHASVVDYPMNVGGRPLHSWPSFFPIVFELTVLGAALFSVLGMLALNGLPMPYHPVFNVPEFRLATRDRFFLCIQARDPLFDRAGTRQFLESLSAPAVLEVPP